MTLLERLRVLSCSEHLTQDELDTVMDAIRYMESIHKVVRDPGTLTLLLQQLPRHGL